MILLMARIFCGTYQMLSILGFKCAMMDNVMQYKLLCATPKYWSPYEGVLIWKANENNKARLHDAEPKPCPLIPMKIEEESIEEYFGFNKYWEIHVMKTTPKLCMVNMDG